VQRAHLTNPNPQEKPVKVTYRHMELEHTQAGIEIRDRNGETVAVCTGWMDAMEKVDELRKDHPRDRRRADVVA
jgi:hypothetical protein